jgi:hypothetical protein
VRFIFTRGGQSKNICRIAVIFLINWHLQFTITYGEAAMIDSLKNQCLTYYSQVMNWYDNLEFFGQFFTLFGVFVVIAVIASLFIVKKVTS